MGRPFKCPYCQSTDNGGKGVRITKTQGVRRIRRCRSCGRKFTPKNQQPLDIGSEAQSTGSQPQGDNSMVSAGESSPGSTPPS